MADNLNPATDRAAATEENSQRDTRLNTTKYVLFKIGDL